MESNPDEGSKLRFTDGMEISTGGKLRTVKKADGWYVVGRGMLLAVESEEDGKALIDKLGGER
ncbi:hypothetical protein ACFL6M_04340 [Candidatus Eisenbacteria bacterium]|uniref:Uncharacterized protein n=1 Tax=Eiseniibacteriota bacterium TaxID=2212470 RepID=A0ABV6YKW3_UNCEI